MRLLVSGSRGWQDAEAIAAMLRHFIRLSVDAGEEFVLIHGHCPKGADALADRAGKELGLRVGEDLIRVPADWGRQKKAAGPIRNQQMLDEYAPDVLVAFRASGKSSGTDDMIGRAEKSGIAAHVMHNRAEVDAFTRHATNA